MDRLTTEQVDEITRIVAKFDNKDRIIRPQTFRERPLMYKEYAELGLLLIAKESVISQNKHLCLVMDNIIRRRWATWLVRGGASPEHKGQWVSDEAGTNFSRHR